MTHPLNTWPRPPQVPPLGTGWSFCKFILDFDWCNFWYDKQCLLWWCMITKDDNNISYIFIPFHIVYDFKVVFQERVKFSMKYMTVLCKLWCVFFKWETILMKFVILFYNWSLNLQHRLFTIYNFNAQDIKAKTN